MSPPRENEERPLVGYTAFVATYASLITAAVLLLRRSGRDLPNPGPAEIRSSASPPTRRAGS